MDNLLEKTRLLSKTIQKGVENPVDFNEVVKTLSKITGSQVTLIGRRGKLLSRVTSDNSKVVYQPIMSLNKKVIDEPENNRLQSIVETKMDNLADGHKITIVPIYGGGERLGTLIFAKPDSCFSIEDLVLFEYAATVTGLEILRLINERKEYKLRERQSLKMAMDVLSYSELEALKLMFSEVSGNEAFLVASTIASKHRLTRSVIVNALRKLESAGVIDARSLGMKGTHVKILNAYFLDKIQAG